jgi:hypothetical protein
MSLIGDPESRTGKGRESPKVTDGSISLRISRVRVHEDYSQSAALPTRPADQSGVALAEYLLNHVQDGVLLRRLHPPTSAP